MNNKKKQVNYNFSKGDIYNLSGSFKVGVDKSVSTQRISDSVIENNNINVIDPSITQALDDLKKMVVTLQKKYPQANEEQAASIIGVEFKEIKRTQPHQWERFLSLKRLWNGLKKGTLKAGEHFAEETPWGKAAIGFLEGVTDDVE
ncbi:hypothetical protein PQG02_09460 [Nostoc sp. UHCC 0926]|uniref:hypothetical protein n=1 Tax=unclassified Nostoc TaxID=2593658 RepID=UPI00235ED139|nr:hypothetical protein [Nostoc sp. UHCC 0926]WDD34525.1 hypothetical protein PQG02_09460 [Nostoc sp. UHCC 0926]